MPVIINHLDFGFLASRWRAAAVIVLLFLLVLTLAQVRRHFIDWSIKGALFGIFFGFLLALFLEGFLIIGGKTAVTELLGWRNAPRPILAAVEAGRIRLVEVLGVTSQISPSAASGDPSVDEAIKVLQSLDPGEIKKVKSLICNP